MAFCHCTGVEETLSVRTAEGNEMSKANLQEVEQVVSNLVSNVEVQCVNEIVYLISKLFLINVPTLATL